MKTSPTFKFITVAIGILVALLIAVTLWVRTPKPASPDSSFVPPPTLPFTPKTFYKIFLEVKRPS